VQDNPEPTEEEQELPQQGRLEEEEAMRYPGHEDPDRQREKGDDEE